MLTNLRLTTLLPPLLLPLPIRVRIIMMMIIIIIIIIIMIIRPVPLSSRRIITIR